MSRREAEQRRVDAEAAEDGDGRPHELDEDGIGGAVARLGDEPPARANHRPLGPNCIDRPAEPLLGRQPGRPIERDRHRADDGAGLLNHDDHVLGAVSMSV
ncbi:MAG: hypothetical protein IPG72_04040 [Ardenticatenales bacterium]|nr:hypothetical protein [Ardenticatenales bacterium]